MAKTLHIKGSGKLILTMSDRQFEDLVRLLQEESTTDRDYYIDETVIGFLTEKGCDPLLVKALQRALENKKTAYRDPAELEPAKVDDEEGDGIDVEWRETEESA